MNTPTVRRNHLGTFTATLVLPSGGRLHAWGNTKPLALEALARKLANYQAVAH